MLSGPDQIAHSFANKRMGGQKGGTWGRVEWQFNAQILKSLIQSEWTQVSDERILARIRELLVEPEIVFGNLGVR